MPVRKSSTFAIALAFLAALVASGLVTPVLFVFAVEEQESVPAVGIFGSFTPFAILSIPVFVFIVGVVAHRIARAAWSAAWLTGAVGGLVAVTCFILVEWLR